MLAAALVIADQHGVAALSMRKLAAELGVAAMSPYHHVRNRGELLDALVDAVFTEVELPTDGRDWREAMRVQGHSVRAVAAPASEGAGADGVAVGAWSGHAGLSRRGARGCCGRRGSRCRWPRTRTP